MSSEPIRAVAEVLRSRWRGAPPMRVVPTAAALPFLAPVDTEAAYHRGEVLLVADALHPARAVAVLAHEGLAHHGLRQILGRAWPGFMSGVLAGSRSDPLLSAARRHVERTYVDDAGECSLTHRQLADEVAAALAERRMDIVTFGLAVDDPVRKQLAAVRGHLAREVLLLDTPACARQLEGALLLAERRVRHGRAFFGWLAGSLDWYARAMAPKFDPTRRPMSHEESKALLAGAESRKRYWEDIKFSAGAIGFVLCILFLVGFVFQGWAWLFQGLRALLH